MAILVILVLGILWAAVLLPPILRSRSESGAPGGIGDFVGKLRSGLGGGDSAGLPPLQPIMGPIGGPAPSAPVGPVRPSAPGQMSSTQRRRRDVLVGLIAGAGVTFLLAMVAGNAMFWLLQLVADGLLGGYVYLLLQFKAQSQARSLGGMPIVGSAPMASNVSSLDAVRQRHTTPGPLGMPQASPALAMRRTATW